jgi:hypothetical protein
MYAFIELHPSPRKSGFLRHNKSVVQCQCRAAGFSLAHREFSRTFVPFAAELVDVLLCVNAVPDFFAQPAQFG